MKRIINNKKGSALLIAMIIFLVVTMLSLALILVSKSLYNTTQKQRSMEQCKEVAQGLSNEIEAELTSVRFNNTDSFEKVLDLAKGTSSNKLWLFLRCNLWQSSWPYYNSDERGHSMQYAAKELPISFAGSDQKAKEILDRTTVTIYWESESEADRSTDTEVYVKVTCSYNGEKSAITTVYALKIERFESIQECTNEAIDSVLAKYYLDRNRTIINPNENWEFVFEDRR